MFPIVLKIRGKTPCSMEFCEFYRNSIPDSTEKNHNYKQPDTGVSLTNFGFFISQLRMYNYTSVEHTEGLHWYVDLYQKY